MSYLPRIAQSYASIRFSGDEIAYYARHILLPKVGTAGQQKLKAARVLVIGAGGIGCPVLQALAGAGVGYMTVIDGDQVALSNLSRQWLHSHQDLGLNKATSAAQSIRDLNPFIQVEAVEQMFAAGNTLDLVAAHDLVVDATDDLDVRYLIDEACARADRPWVHAALYRNIGQVAVFWVRYGANFKALFPERSEAPSCSEAGMMGAFASLVGNVQALRVIYLITGQADPKLGTVSTIDSVAMSWQHFRLPTVELPELYRDSEDKKEFLITADEIKQALSVHEPIRLIDLREVSTSRVVLKNAEQRSVDSLLNAEHKLDSAYKWVLICEEGTISGLLAEAMRSRNLDTVFSLEGGAAAWLD